MQTLDAVLASAPISLIVKVSWRRCDLRDGSRKRLERDRIRQRHRRSTWRMCDRFHFI